MAEKAPSPKEYGTITNEDFAKMNKASWESAKVQINGKTFDGSRSLEAEEMIALYKQIKEPNETSRALFGYSYAAIGVNAPMDDKERAANVGRLAKPGATLNDVDRVVAAIGGEAIKLGRADIIDMSSKSCEAVVGKGDITNGYCKLPSKGQLR